MSEVDVLSDTEVGSALDGVGPLPVVSPPESLLEGPVVFVDVETTGGGFAYNRITEIGIVVARGGELEYEWSSLINPRISIPYGIQQLTGITNEMVADAPAFEDIAADLVKRFEGRLFVAHNAGFDYGFMRQEFQRAGIQFESRVCCTVRLSRRVNPNMPRHNLDMLIAYLGLNITKRHRALPDAQALWQFWCDLRARPVREDIDKVLEKITRIRKPRIKRIRDRAVERVPDQRFADAAGHTVVSTDLDAA